MTTTFKIKGKLPNKYMQITNQGYYTDSNIALLNILAKPYNPTVASAIEFNKDFGISDKNVITQLPDIKRIIEYAMREFARMVNSEDGFCYLQDTKLILDISKDTQARIFYNETTEDYTFIEAKYIDYLKQFNLKYVRLGSNDYSQVGIIDNNGVLVGIVMPIANNQNKYLK